MPRLVRFVIALYPSWWRSRYGQESQELTEELLGDPAANKVGILGSLLFGAITAWTQIKRRADYLQPVSAGMPPMAPLHFPTNPKGHRLAMAIAVGVVVFCIALTGIVISGFLIVNAVGRGIGEAVSEAATEGAATFALSADETAKAHHIWDGALTLSLLNQERLDVKWLPADVSVPLSGGNTYVSVSVAGDEVTTADDIIGCEYGLTVSALNDPIIGQDHLPGTGTYWAASESPLGPGATCSADSAPSSGWERANPKGLGGGY